MTLVRYVVSIIAVALTTFPIMAVVVTVSGVSGSAAALVGMLFGVVTLLIGMVIWSRWEASQPV